MNSSRSLLALLIVLSNFSAIYAQNLPVKKDSTNLYQKIENYSEKRKFTKFLHNLLFKSNTPLKKITPKKQKPKNYSALEGKIIRNINITVMDPFGFSFTDSTERANSWIEKTGNQIHIKSRRFTIRNLLLFKKNSLLDTLLLNESARLVRSQNYIRRIEIVPKLISKDSDSVDVSITVLDAWSIIPKGTFSTSRTTLKLQERNFIGLGHEFNGGITHSLEDGDKAYDVRYRVPNFKNTYISTAVGYKTDLREFYTKFINIERPFYSPLTKWAGGLYVDEKFRMDSLQNIELAYKNQNFKYISLDIWGGYAFKIFEGSSENARTTNLIGSLRSLQVDYRQRPELAFDTIRYFSNENFVMGSLGIASRQFVKDSYIFNDGRTEDVPVGTVYALTVGNQKKNNIDRPYFGLRIAHGKYHKWGYLSTNFEYGTFLRDKETQQTAYSFQANYFTNLISLGGDWYMRQFVKPQFLIGTNRLATPADRITLNERNRFEGFYGNDYQRSSSAKIQGFNSDLVGTTKYLLSLQTQFYAPWEVYGFRLNPYINTTFGAISNENTSIGRGRIYSSFGLGFIVRNDYLVFNNFQISFSYFPRIPGQGSNIIQTNSFETEDFGFQDFNLGKPLPIWYN